MKHKTKKGHIGIGIEFVQGNVSDMPVEDGTFGFVLWTSAFKNFSEPLSALQEMYRVLLPGGLAWISDMRHEVTDGEIDAVVEQHMNMKGFRAWLMKRTFKGTLRKRAYTQERLLELAGKSEFVVVSNEGGGMEQRILLQKRPYDERLPLVGKGGIDDFGHPRIEDARRTG